MILLGIIILAILSYGYKNGKENVVTISKGTSVSDGIITFSYPNNFGLAVTSEQIPVRTYIPPCDQDFNYCLYYIGNEYQGTNFESAGVRIKKVGAGINKDKCFVPPYDGLQKTVRDGKDYSIAIFDPFGQGAAGHYTNGTLYRFSYDGTCYEFETRIGMTQFANYPAGAIKEFTDKDKEAVLAKLASILNSIFLVSGEKINFEK